LKLTKNKGSFIRKVDYSLPFDTYAIEEANGCLYDCEYCFLKGYLGQSDIVVYSNQEDLLNELEMKLKEGKGRRFYLGEYSEPLLINRFFPYLSNIIEFFRGHPENELEIRTKSTDVDFLRGVKPPGNVIFAWSLIPEDISKKVERGVAEIEERIEAMNLLKGLGFRVAVRLEPVIHYDGWKEGYEKLIKKVSFTLDEPVEMGIFRLTPILRKLIYSRNPDSILLKTEFVMCKDGKLRYPRGIRFQIYDYILNLLPVRMVNIYMEESFLKESLGVHKFLK